MKYSVSASLFVFAVQYGMWRVSFLDIVGIKKFRAILKTFLPPLWWIVEVHKEKRLKDFFNLKENLRYLLKIFGEFPGISILVETLNYLLGLHCNLSLLCGSVAVGFPWRRWVLCGCRRLGVVIRWEEAEEGILLSAVGYK